MRYLFKVAGYLLILLLMAILALALHVLLDDRPLVQEDRTLTPAERTWARQWLDANRPDRRRPDASSTLRLSEREANLVANMLLEKIARGRAQVRLEEGRACLAATLMLPRDLAAGFLDVEVDLVESTTLPKLESARIAGLPVPSGLIQGLIEKALESAEQTRFIHAVDIRQDRIQIDYEWQPHLLERLGGGLLAEADRAAILRYQQDLLDWIATRPARGAIPLAEPLSHLLAEAGNRPSSDPVQENRAAILALAAYVNAKHLHAPAEDADEPAPRRYRPVILRGRRDLSQHFMASAALAAQGNDAFSSLIGWYKEMSDADGGSGFSFADLTANRSGIRLAKLATASPEEARRLQRIAAQGLSEDDFMPIVRGLPEGIGKDDFGRSFGDTGAREYRQLIEHIDHRIDIRRLFRTESG